MTATDTNVKYNKMNRVKYTYFCMHKYKINKECLYETGIPMPVAVNRGN